LKKNDTSTEKAAYDPFSMMGWAFNKTEAAAEKKESEVDSEEVQGINLDETEVPAHKV